MLTTVAYALARAFRADHSVFGYSGHFGDDLSARLLELSDRITEEMSGRSAHRRRIAFLLVEAYQNIIRHRAGLPRHIEHGEGRSFFFFRANPEGQDLVAINGVHKAQVEAIQGQLNTIRGLDHAELKELSLEMLQRASTSRGAGVGFIEMTRRSGNELGHMLRGMGPDHALFALAVRSGAAYAPERVLRDGAILHGTVVMNDILLFHVGRVSPGACAVIADMVRHDADTVERAEVAKGRAQLHAALDGALNQLAPSARRVCVLARENDGVVLILGVDTEHTDGSPVDRLKPLLERMETEVVKRVLRGVPRIDLLTEDGNGWLLITARSR